MTPDGKRAVCAATRAAILGIWNLGGDGFYFKAHDELISALTLTPSGNQALTSTWGNQTKLWNLADGQELRAVRLNTRLIGALAVTPDGRRVVVEDFRVLRVFDIESWEEIMSLKSRLGDPRCVTITPDGKHVLAGLEDGSIMGWDLSSGEEALLSQGHRDAVVRLAVTADARRIVSASSDRTVKVWDREAGALIATFSADGALEDLAITPDARTIVAVDGLGRGHFLTVED